MREMSLPISNATFDDNRLYYCHIQIRISAQGLPSCFAMKPVVSHPQVTSAEAVTFNSDSFNLRVHICQSDLSHLYILYLFWSSVLYTY